MLARPALRYVPGRRRVWAGRVLAAIALAAIAIATLTPRPPELPLPRMLGVVSGEMELQDFLANVVLFVPFGLGIGLAAARTRRAVLVALAVSALIEVTQEFFIPGRDASVADVVANVVGGTIGGWIGVHARMLMRPSRTEARLLAAAGTLAAAMVFAFTAWLIAPGAPSAQYEGQFAQHWVKPTSRLTSCGPGVSNPIVSVSLVGGCLLRRGGGCGRGGGGGTRRCSTRAFSRLDRWFWRGGLGLACVQVACWRRWQRSNASTSWLAHGHPAAIRSLVCRPVRAISPAAWRRV